MITFNEALEILKHQTEVDPFFMGIYRKVWMYAKCAKIADENGKSILAVRNVGKVFGLVLSNDLADCTGVLDAIVAEMHKINKANGQ